MFFAFYALRDLLTKIRYFVGLDAYFVAVNGLLGIYI